MIPALGVGFTNGGELCHVSRKALKSDWKNIPSEDALVARSPSPARGRRLKTTPFQSLQAALQEYEAKAKTAPDLTAAVASADGVQLA